MRDHKKGVSDAMQRYYDSAGPSLESVREIAISKTKKRGSHSVAPGCCEYHEQCAVVAWLKGRRLIYCASANGATLAGGIDARRKQWSKLAKSGARKGFPDLLVFNACKAPMGTASVTYVGCAIEMKRDKKSRASDEQKQWLQGLHELGWYTFIGHGAKDTIDKLEQLQWV